MSLTNSRMKSLADKHLELEKEQNKVKSEMDELAGDKKVKIIRKSLKKA